MFEIISLIRFKINAFYKKTKTFFLILFSDKNVICNSPINLLMITITIDEIVFG